MLRALLLFSILQYGISKIRETELHPEVQKCFNKQRQKYGVKQAVGLYMYNNCINMHVCKILQKNVRKTSQKHAGFIGRLINKVVYRNGRIKRQARGYRIRSEIRQLSDQQLQRYHRAVNRLKDSGRYDALADIHRGDKIPQVHDGPAFASWHRIYLLLYEAALRQYDSSVSVPYYASHLDDEMGLSGERAKSVVWSERFFGNCEGFVTTGPFRNWQTPTGALMRNCGTMGSPFSYDGIDQIMSRRLNSEIFAPWAETGFNLEEQHDAVHGWIGGNGQMTRLDFAPHDPVFWNHHAFVDKLWYDFRSRQRRWHGIGTPDYPTLDGNLPGHGPDDNITFTEESNNPLTPFIRQIGRMTNRQAYQDYIVDGIYHYREVPTWCESGCERSSPYYTCSQDTNRCRSLSLSEGFGSGTRQSRDRNGTSRFKRQVTDWNINQSKTKTSSMLHQRENVKAIDRYACSESLTDRSMQNSFYIDGKVDSSKWVYIAVEVVYSRPPEKKVYDSFPLKNGKMSKPYDIYSPHMDNKLESKLSQGHPKTYHKCENPKSNAAMIFIGSEGLNYYGNYKDYVVADKRMAVSSTKGYVAVKSPEDRDTDAMISAHDSCGRVCKAYCQVPGSKTMYKRCNGVLKITKETPKMYGKSIAECLNEMWNLDQNGYCPSTTDRGVFIKFFCDYKDDWPFGIFSSVHRGNKKSEECEINHECTIRSSCLGCRHNEKHMCGQTSNTYAKCVNGRYRLFRCYRNYYFDDTKKLCRHKRSFEQFRY